MDEADGAAPLSVRITTPADAWCNFAPLGLPGYHIAPGKTVVLAYARKENGGLEMQAEGSCPRAPQGAAGVHPGGEG